MRNKLVWILLLMLGGATSAPSFSYTPEDGLVAEEAGKPPFKTITDGLSDCNAQSKQNTLYIQIFAGYTGAAFGYIGRWDYFGVAFVPFVFCCLQCGFACCGQVGHLLHAAKLLYYCLIVPIFLFILIFWIWGIIEISGSSFKNGDGCFLREDKISCFGCDE